MEKMPFRSSACFPQCHGARLRPVVLRRDYALILLLCVLLPALAPGQQEQHGQATDRAASLKFTGTVTRIAMVESESAMKVQISVNLVGENAGNEPVIVLRRAPRTNTEYLFTSPTGGEPLWVLSHPAPVVNVYQSHQPELLKADVDKKDPPDDFTILLNPGDTIGWDIPLELDFKKTAEPRDVQVGTPSRPVWDVVKKSCPCWLKLDLDLWPASVEPRQDATDPVLARKLAARWKKQGDLVYTEQRSEGISLNLQQGSR
ncbi:MAG: hypothetical protein ACM3SW_15225 [Actinomycetota bacterium]